MLAGDLCFSRHHLLSSKVTWHCVCWVGEGTGMYLHNIPFHKDSVCIEFGLTASVWTHLDQLHLELFVPN